VGNGACAELAAVSKWRRAKAPVNTNTKAAAPPVCITAANKGQPNTMFDKPVNNCNPDSASSQRLSERQPGNRYNNHAVTTSAANTT
jgi:hypothetical protein